MGIIITIGITSIVDVNDTNINNITWKQLILCKIINKPNIANI